MLAFDRERETLPILGSELALDAALAAKARRAVALREEMSVDERYEIMEMLGLISGNGDEVQLDKTVSVQGWQRSLR